MQTRALWSCYRLNLSLFHGTSKLPYGLLQERYRCHSLPRNLSRPRCGPTCSAVLLHVETVLDPEAEVVVVEWPMAMSVMLMEWVAPVGRENRETEHRHRSKSCALQAVGMEQMVS